MGIDAWMRSGILSLAESNNIQSVVRRLGPKLGAYRFVAGDTLHQALAAAADLNALGLQVTLDRLGEGNVDGQRAREAAATYVKMLQGIGETGVQSTVSLKLTQLGLDLQQEDAENHLRAILDAARRHGTFVRIDMEDARHTDATITLFERVRRDYDNVGLVLQAYLRRSAADLVRLEALDANLRIVKGAYMEPPEVAFERKTEVDENYQRLVAHHLSRGQFTAIATHDAHLIERLKAWIAQENIPNERFEFQMLYGIRPRLAQSLVREGYAVRIYVPFGPDWYPYFMRRLAERPANLAFFIKNLLRP